MPHVEITSDVNLRLRVPVAAEVLEARREEARDASHVAKRKRIRHTPPNDTEMYGPEIVLCRGVTEVSDEVAAYIDTLKGAGDLRSVTVIRNDKVGRRRAASVKPREKGNPEVLTPGAVKHGTDEWARMEAERLAAEAQDGAATARTPQADDELPVYGCPGCPEGTSEFPSQAALDRHWQINHGNDALPEGSTEADDTATASADTVPTPTDEPPSGEEF